ncbi:hypothetical protein BLNAU_19011 [Blattamonas nauphoetae]|uniref:Uncharacterized protein n=1 Tax=Blattamonas nauphoetae TaxID=2049346 RepID=A0ABQ9X2Q2_9EUKA|nr:hypothetical protein BLNAU_19011 [Blattamonas nauphoetae]
MTSAFFTINKRSTYYTLIFNCDAQDYTVAIRAEYKNRRSQHLSSELIPLPYASILFITAFFILGMVNYMFSRYIKNAHYHTRLVCVLASFAMFNSVLWIFPLIGTVIPFFRNYQFTPITITFFNLIPSFSSTFSLIFLDLAMAGLSVTPTAPSSCQVFLITIFGIAVSLSRFFIPIFVAIPLVICIAIFILVALILFVVGSESQRELKAGIEETAADPLVFFSLQCKLRFIKQARGLFTIFTFAIVPVFICFNALPPDLLFIPLIMEGCVSLFCVSSFTALLFTRYIHIPRMHLIHQEEGVPLPPLQDRIELIGLFLLRDDDNDDSSMASDDDFNAFGYAEVALREAAERRRAAHREAHPANPTNNDDDNNRAVRPPTQQTMAEYAGMGDESANDEAQSDDSDDSSEIVENVDEDGNELDFSVEDMANLQRLHNQLRMIMFIHRLMDPRVDDDPTRNNLTRNTPFQTIESKDANADDLESHLLVSLPDGEFVMGENTRPA